MFQTLENCIRNEGDKIRIYCYEPKSMLMFLECEDTVHLEFVPPGLGHMVNYQYHWEDLQHWRKQVCNKHREQQQNQDC